MEGGFGYPRLNARMGIRNRRTYIYVTGSAKRYTNAQAMIFLYKRCCSKTHNIFYALKKKIFGLRYLQLFAYTHAKIEELNVLLTGQARSLKTAT